MDGLAGRFDLFPAALARWLAGELLAELPDRWRHTQGVAAQARAVGAALAPPERELLVAAAWLHDIGYSARLARSGFHPLDGGRYLRDLGLPTPLTCLVAHHSGAVITAAEYGLEAALLAEFPAPDGPVLDALVYADMTTGPRGQRMTFEERIGELLRRHGPDSAAGRVLPLRYPYLAAAVERVERVAAHGRVAAHAR